MGTIVYCSGNLGAQIKLRSFLFVEALVEIKYRYELWPNDLTPEYISQSSYKIHVVRDTKVAAELLSMSNRNFGGNSNAHHWKDGLTIEGKE